MAFELNQAGTARPDSHHLSQSIVNVIHPARAIILTLIRL